MQRRRRAALVLAAACLLAPSLAQAQVRIGLAAPLTGPDAGFGQGVRLGAEQAIADINRAGGVNGQKLQLIVQDDASDAKQGVVVARKFAASGVKFVVGHLNSGVSAVTLPIYEEAGIIAVNPGATWRSLTNRGAWNIFRVCGSDAQQGTLAGAWLAATFRNKPVAIVNDKSSFGRNLADEVARTLRSRGGREALFEGIARGEKDFSAIAGRIRAAGAEAVYFGGLHTEAALLLRAMREAGVQAPLVGSDGLLDKDFPQLAGPGAEGTLMTMAPDPRRLPEPRSAKTPRAPEADTFAAQSYAAVEVLRQGMEAAKSAEPRKIADVLHAGKPLRTVIGEIAFDAKGDLAKPAYELFIWRKTPDGRIDYAGNEVAP